MKKKLVIVYLSTSGNTKRMADAIARGAESLGVNVKEESFYDVDMDDLKNADAIALGSSTFWYKMHDAMAHFIDRLEKMNLSGKIGAAFGSYGWSGEAVAHLQEALDRMKMKQHGALKVKNVPKDVDLDACRALGRSLAAELRASTAA